MLKLAMPAARFAEVVPVSIEALSEMVTEELAEAASDPLSVSFTTGAGEIGWAKNGLAGGSVEKASPYLVCTAPESTEPDGQLGSKAWPR